MGNDSSTPVPAFTSDRLAFSLAMAIQQAQKASGGPLMGEELRPLILEHVAKHEAARDQLWTNAIRAEREAHTAGNDAMRATHHGAVRRHRERQERARGRVARLFERLGVRAF